MRAADVERLEESALCYIMTLTRTSRGSGVCWDGTSSSAVKYLPRCVYNMSLMRAFAEGACTSKELVHKCHKYCSKHKAQARQCPRPECVGQDRVGSLERNYALWSETEHVVRSYEEMAELVGSVRGERCLLSMTIEPGCWLFHSLQRYLGLRGCMNVQVHFQSGRFMERSVVDAARACTYLSNHVDYNVCLMYHACGIYDWSDVLLLHMPRLLEDTKRDLFEALNRFVTNTPARNLGHRRGTQISRAVGYRADSFAYRGGVQAYSALQMEPARYASGKAGAAMAARLVWEKLPQGVRVLFERQWPVGIRRPVSPEVPFAGAFCSVNAAVPPHTDRHDMATIIVWGQEGKGAVGGDFVMYSLLRKLQLTGGTCIYLKSQTIWHGTEALEVAPATFTRVGCALRNSAKVMRAIVKEKQSGVLRSELLVGGTVQPGSNTATS